MQRLFSRNDSGYWSAFQGSTGDSIDTSSKSTALRVWFAKGPALRKFDTEIRPELLSVLRNCDLPTTQEVFLRLYMIGRTPEQAKPMVMICCVDPRIRKHGKTAVKKSGKLDSFPEYGLSSRALPFESTGVLQPCQGAADWDDTRGSRGVYPQPHCSLVGRRIVNKTDDNVAPMWATGGAILQIGDQAYQMTVSHFIRPKESQSPGSQESEDWDLSDCELEEDFEGQWGTEAGTTEESYGDVQSNSVGAELPSHQLQSNQTILPPDGRPDHFTPGFDASATGLTESLITLCEDILDYALVEVNVPLAAEPKLNNTFDDVNGVLRTITGVSPVPDTETNVTVITSGGSLKGVLMPGSTTRRAKGTKNFQNIYTVTLEGDIREGDCGSAVVDSHTGTLYGHVVLGCVGTSLAYFVPATEVIQDIRHRTGREVTLESFHYHRGSPTVQREHISPAYGLASIPQGSVRRIPSSRAREFASSTEKVIPETDGFDSNLSCESELLLRGYTNQAIMNQIDESAIPDTRFRLGYWSVMALVVNRMIGSGIFYSPAAVHSYTGSLLSSLLLWAFGGVFILIGTLIWIELGLSIPRVNTKYGSFSVPRSGGDKNYLECIFSSTAYRPQTWLLSTFLYGTMFITLGNMAGNSVNFAASVLRASGTEDPGPNFTRLLAIGGVVLCFLLNVFSRRAGIWLNNIFALVKVLVVIFVICIGIIVGLTDARRSNVAAIDPVWPQRDAADTEAASTTNTSVGFTTAVFAIIFAYSGFDEANYVLREVDRPRRKFPIATLAGVSLVILLCIAMSACYALVVPTGSSYRDGSSLAETFFESIFSRGQPNRIAGSTIFYAAMALSSFGNIAVMTYTSARVTQEIAKEGILPWSIPIASNTKSLLQRVWSSPKRSWLQVQTPVGGLVFQLALSIVTILAITRVATPDDAYNLLSALAAYSKSISAACLGVGVLFSGRLWRTSEIQWPLPHKPTLPPPLRFLGRFRTCWARVGLSLFTILSLEIVLLPWAAWLAPRFLDLRAFHGVAQGWSLVPTLMAVPFVLGIGSLWFWGSVAWARYWERKVGKKLVVQRVPILSEEEDERGCKRPNQLIQVHEIVMITWAPLERIDGASSRRT